MSKLSFRARALDASKPLPIYMSEELPDLPEYSAINRAVPQMPSGMEKEEECEHHLQRAIVTGLIIPTPEVTKVDDTTMYDRLYPPTYKQPRQLIRMQPFAMEEDYPDYDIDSEDEKWITMQKLDISPRKFEEMMDRLEKNCAQNFATQDRKELLLKDDDELSIAIYDYWLSKRLKTQPQPLVPSVKTEVNNRTTGGGSGGPNSNSNPYLAFRRRTEKMQTRKNRKNDEASYEKMIKLRRDLSRALNLLELVKRRENTKRQLLYVTIQLYEKRYQANDLSGALLAEVSALKSSRPAFTPLYTNQYTPNHSTWPIKPPKEEVGLSRKEKRQYKKRKHKGVCVSSSIGSGISGLMSGGNISSGEEDLGVATPASPVSPTHQVAFPFLRNKNCTYQAPLSGGKIGNWGWCGPEEGGSGEERYRFSLTSVCLPHKKCIGLARRRLGRGGRVVIDRAGPSLDDFWASLDFTIHDSFQPSEQPLLISYRVMISFRRHFQPKSPTTARVPSSSESEEVDIEALPAVSGPSSLSLQVESLTDSEVTSVELDLSELFPELECEVLRQELGASSGSGSGSGGGGGGGGGGGTRGGGGGVQRKSPGGGSSLFERWVETTTNIATTNFPEKRRTHQPQPPPPPPAPTLLDRLFSDMSSESVVQKTVSSSASECEFVGSSAFNVTDGKDRTRTGRVVNQPVYQCVPTTLSNGPINSHNDRKCFPKVLNYLLFLQSIEL
ncbi:hypothetical protein AAG570_000349 [Ranatra chinensis]|uniref:Enhancer of polycomb-like protein n=1 Tax=Ranatra chinensis TaxID=642074 RepID=A0ABD0YWV0_9HEMI